MRSPSHTLAAGFAQAIESKTPKASASTRQIVHPYTTHHPQFPPSLLNRKDNITRSGGESRTTATNPCTKCFRLNWRMIAGMNK